MNDADSKVASFYSAAARWRAARKTTDHAIWHLPDAVVDGHGDQFVERPRLDGDLLVNIHGQGVGRQARSQMRSRCARWINPAQPTPRPAGSSPPRENPFPPVIRVGRRSTRARPVDSRPARRSRIPRA